MLRGLFLLHRQLLLIQVIAVEITVITGLGCTAQAEAVISCFCYKSEAALLDPALRIPVAPPVHSGFTFQRSPDTQFIHEFLEGLLELRRIELVIVVRPPGVVESAAAKIKAHMPDCRDGRVLLQIRQGIKLPRFFTGRSYKNSTCNKVLNVLKLFNDYLNYFVFWVVFRNIVPGKSRRREIQKMRYREREFYEN